MICKPVLETAKDCRKRGKCSHFHPQWLRQSVRGSLVVAFAILALSLTGCAISTKTGLAVIPAISTSHQKSETAKGIDTTHGLPASIAVLPFINRTKEQAAFDIVRKTMFNHLSTRNYHLPHLHDVDQRLKAAGWSDPATLESVPVNRLTETLGVDAVLYGEITSFNRYFLGIYSQIAVGVRLRLVDHNGKELWHGANTVRTHAGGISLSPVGLILDAIAAATHLREVNMYRAADDLGRELIPQIPQPEQMAAITPPRITQVVHDGVGRLLHYGDSLKVAMEGEPGLKGFVRIDGWKTFDLREEQKGFYTATITIDSKVNLRHAALVGVLTNDDSVQSEQISPIGLITIDNQPPAKVQGLHATTISSGIRLDWSSIDRDIYSYAIAKSAHALGPFRDLGHSKDPQFTDPYAQPFTTQFYRISATDLAGNQGEAVTISAQRLPDARFSSAKPLPSRLGGEIHGIHRLRASDGPFQLQGTLLIAADGVLLVEPGVTIESSANGALRVEGELQMLGSAQRGIRLHGGKGITLATTAPVSLQYVTIEQAAVAITTQIGAATINHSHLIHSSYSALDIQGTSRPQILNSEIRGASSSAVVISGRAQPTLHGNVFSENQPFHMQNGSTYRIDASGNRWQPAASPMTILGNVDYSGATK
ncbi:MAG: DUF799 family lipoprotein [Mariprofundales bacterium]|nr:DUF799 family lipoprotein [Mariprofundales bacterium]